MGKTALVFNPYFNTLGGGEKYTATVMSALEQASFNVTLAWNDLSILEHLFERFGVSYTHVTVDPEFYRKIIHSNSIQKHSYLKQFDLIFWVSDGSIPLLSGKNNILHFQVPFRANYKSLANKFKLTRINRIICNSSFTKKYIDASYGVNSTVVYPPCQLIESGSKEKYILAVGRFDGLLHSKRQDILIEAYQKLNPEGWQLILAGGNLGDASNVDKLQQLAGKSNINFVINPSFTEIVHLYSQASIFWHAAGYQVDEENHPEQVEHFGIATVEAMSSGAVPLVYNAGGQKEIIRNNENGYTWETIDELISKTNQLINAPTHLQTMSHIAQQSSRQFSQERFIHEFTNILS